MSDRNFDEHEHAAMKRRLLDLLPPRNEVAEKYRGKYAGQDLVFSDEYRDRHLFVAGGSRTGKSTLLQNMALQDIWDDKSITFIDPDGDSVKEILRHIPEDRINDTVYLEPSKYPVALDLMRADTDQERARLIGDVVTIFKRLSDSGSWGERMDAILRKTVQTLTHIPESTFMDILNMVDEDRLPEREALLAQLTDSTLKAWWDEFPPNGRRYPPNAAEPLVSRLTKFDVDPNLRGMTGTRGGVSISELMSGDTIFLVDLSEVAPDVKGILGSLIVFQMQFEFARRAAIAKDARPWHYLYIDEFQRFYVPGFEDLCQQAGKFHVCLTLASHFPSQVKDDLRKNIVGTFGNFLSLRIGAEDAPLMAKMLGIKDADDLIHLKNDDEERLAFIRTPRGMALFATAPPAETDDDFSAEIKRRNKERFKKRVAESTPRPAPTAPATASRDRSDETVLPSNPPGKSR